MSKFEGTLTKRAKARLGRVLKDKWRLEKLLGVGGTAAVYEARHRNGQKVAVKFLHAEMSEDADMRTRFLREGYVANKIGHPGALAILDDDLDEDDGSVFLVMELLEGETLNERWKRSNKILQPAEVLLFAAQVLEILGFAHKQGIVHRDIKPENLFLTNDGQLKVLDFGIARMRDSMSRIRLTQTGTAMGTPAFMSPEQARGRSELICPKTDLWAVGATMFTLLSGHIVHEAGTGNEQLLAAMMRPARSLAAVAPAMPKAVVAAVDRALQFEKDARFGSAEEMEIAVRAAFIEITGHPLESAARILPAAADSVASMDRLPQPVWENSTPKRKSVMAGPAFPWAIGGAIGAVGLVVIGAAFFVGRSGMHPLAAAGSQAAATQALAPIGLPAVPAEPEEPAKPAPPPDRSVEDMGEVDRVPAAPALSASAAASAASVKKRAAPAPHPPTDDPSLFESRR
jgi:serine/threonine-protein kinase